MLGHLDHVAFLVNSAAAAAEAFEVQGCDVGPVEEFPGEGTREVYIGEPGASGRVLLMEAIGPGPYKSALERRGMGLHHVGLRVADLSGYVAGLAGSGWYLHPVSLATHSGHGTVWLARPGAPVLIEVVAGKRPGKQAVISRLTLPVPRRLVDALGCDGVVAGDTTEVQVGSWAFAPTEVCAR